MTTSNRTPNRLDAELAAVEIQRADAVATYRAAQEALRAISNRRQGLVTRKIDALTDEQILADEDTRRWLCREVNLNAAASGRVRELLRYRYGGQFYDNTWDGRDEYADQWLPVPNLTMLRGSDVTETAQAIREIAKVWLLGRPTLPLHIFERTLAAHGFYHAEYDPAEDTAVLYHRHLELFSGSLVEVLERIARDHYYRDPARTDEHGNRIDDDIDEDGGPW